MKIFLKTDLPFISPSENVYILDDSFEKLRARFLNFEKLLNLVSKDLIEKNAQLSKNLVLPISNLPPSFQSFVKEKALPSIIEYSHITEIISIVAESFMERQKSFLSFIEKYFTELESLKKRIEERDRIYFEMLESQKQYDIIEEKTHKSLDKIVQLEKRQENLNKRYISINQTLFDDLSSFISTTKQSFQTEFNRYLISRVTLFHSISEAFSKLTDKALMKESPPKITIYDSSKSLTSYIQENFYFKESTPVCPICKRQLTSQMIESHSQFCSSAVSNYQNLKKDRIYFFNIDSLWLENWDHLQKRFSEKKNPKLRNAIRQQGIPPELRPKLWPLILNIEQKKTSSAVSYSSLLLTFKNKTSTSTIQIDKDLHRTFSKEPVIQNPEFISSLKNVLMVYSFSNPLIGYCQSLNFLCAVLLVYLSEEDSFWSLTTIIEDMLPDFYSKQMTGISVEQKVFKSLLAMKLPKLSAHLESLDLDINPILVRWFLCLYVSVFSLEGSIRVFELFMYEGSKFLLRLGLAIFKICEKNILQIKDISDLLILLQNMADDLDFNEVIKTAVEIKITQAKVSQLRSSYLPVLKEEKKKNHPDIYLETEDTKQIKRHALRLKKDTISYPLIQINETLDPSEDLLPTKIEIPKEENAIEMGNKLEENGKKEKIQQDQPQTVEVKIRVIRRNKNSLTSEVTNLNGGLSNNTSTIEEETLKN